MKTVFWILSACVFAYLGASVKDLFAAAICTIVMLISLIFASLPILMPYLKFDKQPYELIEKIGKKDSENE